MGLNKAGSSTEETSDLSGGGALLLYTDGLYEIQNSEGNRLGNDALARLLPKVVDTAASAWLEGIIEKTNTYANSVSFPDDIAAFAAIRET